MNNYDMNDYANQTIYPYESEIYSTEEVDAPLFNVNYYRIKGKKNIPSLRISKGVFEAIYQHYKLFSRYVESINIWNCIKKGLWNKAEIYFINKKELGEANKKRVIINGARLSGCIWGHFNPSRPTDNLTSSESTETGLRNLMEYLKGTHKDYELILDASLKDDTFIKCRPQDVKKSLKAAIKKDFTEEQFQEFVDTNGISEEDKIKNGIRPLHFNTLNNLGSITKYTNCIYQDIHKAHASFLLNTFKNYPNVTKFVNKHLKAGKEAKKNKNLELAKKEKDYLNFAVGLLGQTYKEDTFDGHKKGEPIKWCLDINTRPLFNKCVQITRHKIDEQIKNIRINGLDSKLLYANTDGFIMKNPDWNKIKSTEEIGEFGTEKMKNNEVWFFSCCSGTPYQIHQYFDENGKKIIVGNLPDVLKDMVDLSKGIIVTYHQTKDIFNMISYESINTEIINIKEE